MQCWKPYFYFAIHVHLFYKINAHVLHLSSILYKGKSKSVFFSFSKITFFQFIICATLLEQLQHISVLHTVMSTDSTRNNFEVCVTSLISNEKNEWGGSLSNWKVRSLLASLEFIWCTVSTGMAAYNQQGNTSFNKHKNGRKSNW